MEELKRISERDIDQHLKRLWVEPEYCDTCHTRLGGGIFLASESEKRMEAAQAQLEADQIVYNILKGWYDKLLEELKSLKEERSVLIDSQKAHDAVIREIKKELEGLFPFPIARQYGLIWEDYWQKMGVK